VVSPSKSAGTPREKSSCKGKGILVPVIDPKRCEAKADCIRVCPTGVFELRTPSAAEKAALGFFGRLKLRVHGGQQAVVASPSACEACGLCVPACPEDAITLRSVDVSAR
jgi:NAD-dependent dihydropyrimidine dehydrogenase PreA subunit